jgi:hypothetical protein
MTLNGFGPVFCIARRNQRELQLRSCRCPKQQCGGFCLSICCLNHTITENIMKRPVLRHLAPKYRRKLWHLSGPRVEQATSSLKNCTISLKSARYLWCQFDTSSSRGYAYCFPRSQDYWGSWRHSTLLEPKPNWAGSPTGIFIPPCLLDVNETRCLREALRNTEFIPAKLILSIASERHNRIFHSPSVLVEQIPYARCHQRQRFVTFFCRGSGRKSTRTLFIIDWHSSVHETVKAFVVLCLA